VPNSFFFFFFFFPFLDISSSYVAQADLELTILCFSLPTNWLFLASHESGIISSGIWKRDCSEWSRRGQLYQQKRAEESKNSVRSFTNRKGLRKAKTGLVILF
jgi:hypothetical protein